MEILYLWLDEYKTLKNISVNFGSNFIFKFENGTLQIFNNEMYIEKFFSLPSFNSNSELVVKNVTGIVGENGTGKSTILEFLLELLCSEGVLSCNYFVVYRIGSEIFFDCNIENKFNKEIMINSYTNDKEIIMAKRINTITKKVIFFSNVFDARAAKISKEENFESLLNLSTNYLSSNTNTESNLRYLNEEFTRQIFFVNKYIDSLELNELINIPDFVKIELKMFDLEAFDNKFKDVMYLFEDECAPILLKNFRENKFKYNFHMAVIKSSLIDIGEFISGINHKWYDAFIEALREFTFHVSESNIYESIGSHYLQDIKDHIEEEVSKHVNNRMLKKYIKEIDKRVKIRIDLLNTLDLLDFKDITPNTLKIKTESDIFSDFLKDYNNISIRYSFIDFTWTELSSGEYALLSLLSRFHSIKDQLDSQNIILIDEGDLYFHPQWQKDWLYHFLRALNVIYTEKEVQVILTTHSPFVLSDLPSNNVIFLEKYKGKNAKVSNGLEGGQLTFAANIHNLFTNSFFIKNGLCGTFAKEKINNLVEELLSSSAEHIRLNENRIRNTIEVIGEPIVKNKLLNLFEEKIRLDLISIDRKIIELQRQLDNLKGLKVNE